jgi:hypothetical protein
LSREINIEEADKWTAKETEENIAYLEQRSLLTDIDRVREVRDEAGKKTPATAAEEAAVEEEAPTPKKR